HLRTIRRALDLYPDSSKFSIARFVGRIVTQTVLRPDLVCYARKGRARVLETRSEKIPAAACLRHLVHFAPRKIVEVAADLHLFKGSHLAEIYKVFRPGLREKNLPVALQLFSGQRQPSV